MDIQELITRINQCVNDLDLISARKYIEENKEVLNENKHHLEGSARELFEFLISSSGGNTQSLNRDEMNIIYSINTYASKFDIRGLKLIVQNNTDLLMRSDVFHYLNEDAKTLLEGMNVISS